MSLWEQILVNKDVIQKASVASVEVRPTVNPVLLNLLHQFKPHHSGDIPQPKNQFSIAGVKVSRTLPQVHWKRTNKILIAMIHYNLVCSEGIHTQTGLKVSNINSNYFHSLNGIPNQHASIHLGISLASVSSSLSGGISRPAEDLVSPACPGSSPVLPASETLLEHLSREESRRCQWCRSRCEAAGKPTQVCFLIFTASIIPQWWQAFLPSHTWSKLLR